MAGLGRPLAINVLGNVVGTLGDMQSAKDAEKGMNAAASYEDKAGAIGSALSAASPLGKPPPARASTMSDVERDGSHGDSDYGPSATTRVRRPRGMR